MGQPELARSTKRLMQLAVRMANGRMRSEILPLLGSTNPNLARSWNPLVPDYKGVDDLGMKLRMPDRYVMQILRDDRLMQHVDEIVEDAVIDAFQRNIETENTPFLAALIRDGFRADQLGDHE